MTSNDNVTFPIPINGEHAIEASVLLHDLEILLESNALLTPELSTRILSARLDLNVLAIGVEQRNG